MHAHLHICIYASTHIDQNLNMHVVMHICACICKQGVLYLMYLAFLLHVPVCLQSLIRMPMITHM